VELFEDHYGKKLKQENVDVLRIDGNADCYYFKIPFYLQSVPAHSANCVRK
jgi:hypothetical protein